jgi:hypothetical protein
MIKNKSHSESLQIKYVPIRNVLQKDSGFQVELQATERNYFLGSLPQVHVEKKNFQDFISKTPREEGLEFDNPRNKSHLHYFLSRLGSESHSLFIDKIGIMLVL